MLEGVVKMPTNGPHEAYSPVGLAKRQMKRKWNNTAFTTAFQCHTHIHYLVPGYLRRPRAMALGKRDMSKAEGSYHVRLRRRSWSRRSSKNEIWLEPGKQDYQWSFKLEGLRDYPCQGASNREDSFLSWDQSSTARFFPIQYLVKGEMKNQKQEWPGLHKAKSWKGYAVQNNQWPGQALP